MLKVKHVRILILVNGEIDGLDPKILAFYGKENTIGPYLYPAAKNSTIKSTYYGNYNHGQRHGYGHEITSSGSTYLGQFQNDLRHGKGRFVSTDGDLY